MSVADINPIQEYGKNAGDLEALEYSFTFPIISVHDIEIRFDGEVKPNSGSTAYTVTASKTGGKVTFTTKPKAADPGLKTLQIRRKTPFTRDTQYTDNGDLLAQTVNDDFDRLWLCLQEQRAAADASLSRPAGTKFWEAQQLPISHVADGVADDDAMTVGQSKRDVNSAAASKTAAAASATDAAGSLASARTAQTGAETARTGAEAAQKKAETAQGKAETAQAAAEAAAGKAANDATAAAQAQIAPLVAQATAQRNAAEAAATKAADDATNAAHAQIKPFSDAAAASATAAAGSATKAANDAQKAAQALIQPYVTEAKGYKEQAALSASNAATSAATASGAATRASGSESSALKSALAAAGSATAADASAKSAESSAARAANLKDATAAAAASAATTAAAAASAQNSASAAQSAQDAESAKDSAETAQTAAEAAQTAAENALDDLKAAALEKAANLSDVADKQTALINLGLDAARDSASQSIYAPDQTQTNKRGMRLTMTTNAGVNSWGFYGRDNKLVPLDPGLMPPSISLRVVNKAIPGVTAGTNGGQLLCALNDGSSDLDVASASLRVIKLKNADGTHSARALLSVSDFDTPGTGEKNSIMSFESTGNLSITGGLRGSGLTLAGGPSTGEIVTLQPDTNSKNCYIRFRDSTGAPTCWIGNDLPATPGKFTISSTLGGNRIDLNADGTINYNVKAGQTHNFNGSTVVHGNIYAGSTTFSPIASGAGAPGQFRDVEAVHANYVLTYPDGNSAPGLYVHKRSAANGAYSGTITCDDNGNWALNRTLTVAGSSDIKGGLTTTLITASNGINVTKGNLTVSAGTISASGTVSAAGKVLTSDINLKENIGEAKAGAAERIAAVKLHSYDWKDGRLPHRDVGVIAQELEAIDPMYVSTIDGVMHYDPDMLMLDLLATVQELQKEVAALKAEKS